MSQTCSICKSPKRVAIEKMILQGIAIRGIARKYAMSEDSVQRHKKHLKKSLVKSREVAEVKNGISLRERFDKLVADAADSLKKAKTDRDRIGWHGVLANWMNLAFKLGIEEARLREQQIFKDVTPAVEKMIEEAKG